MYKEVSGIKQDVHDLRKNTKEVVDLSESENRKKLLELEEKIMKENEDMKKKFTENQKVLDNLSDLLIKTE